jgi:hypothetical protein
LSRFIALGDELPEDAAVATGLMLSIRPKPGRMEAAAAATGAEGAEGVACGAVTTVDEDGGEGGTTTTGAGCLLPHAPSNATARTDAGRIRNLLIASLLGEISSDKQ